jgi:hypothetical protein
MNRPRRPRPLRFDPFARASIIHSVQLAVFCAFLAAATTSGATTYWIDASKTAVANCGKTAATACPSWSRLMGTLGCPGSCGCDADGCENNITAASTVDSINFVGPGTYVGDGNGRCIGYPFNRAANSELTIQCTDASGTYTPGKCTISATGLSLPGSQAVVIAGASTKCADDSATFVKWKGINITNIPPGTGGWRTKGGVNSHHLLLADSLIDGTTSATGDLIIYGDLTHYVSFVNNVITNCGATASFGCLGNERNDHEAVVGNAVGPIRNFPVDRNTDGITVQNADTVLIDGNIVHGNPDGIDVGMLDSRFLGNIIIRYNDTYDMAGDVSAGADNNIVLSGDSTSGTNTGPVVAYKNVLRSTNPAYSIGFWRTKEGAKDADFWYNTTFGANYNVGDVNNSHLANLGLSSGSQVPSTNLPIMYNLFDGTTVQNLTTSCSSAACPMNNAVTTCTAASCKFVGNGLWYAERGGSSSCLRFSTSDIPGLTFKCDLTRFGGGAGLNSTGANTGNFRADPKFVNRGGTHLADYALTSASTYIDAGKSFCHAVSAGSGNTITVTCDGASTDPRHFFPQPSNYYSVQNGDCAGRGTRASEANGSLLGCYDIQIQGCSGGGGLGNLTGVRTVTSMTGTTITFSGASCTWAANAMVHVPWTGNAPDVGALEFASTAPQAPTLIDVQPVP